jgi:hypothetical protein
MDLTASSAVNLPISKASLRLVVVWMETRSIRCTYSGARVPPRFTLTINLVFFIGLPLVRVTTKWEAVSSHFPFLSTGYLVSRSLAGSLGFDGLLAANTNFDLRGLGEDDLQHPLVTVGAHLSRIHGTGKRERAGKASVLPFDATEVLLFFLLLNLALAMDGEGVVLNADINVFFVDARDVDLQNNVVSVCVYVHRRCEGSWLSTPLPGLQGCSTHGKGGSCVHAFLHGGKFAERFPTG